MKLFKVIAVVCLAVTTITSPVPQTNNDAVTDFLRNDQLPVQEREGAKIKRRIYEENNDRHLKQISLSSLIGDLEQGLFASALSVNKILTDKNVNVPEIKPNADNLTHDVNKRHSLNKEETGNDETSAAAAAAATTEASALLPVSNKIVLQTTEKVPADNAKPAHIVIDRIAIQPHTGGVAFIPIFELKRTIKDDNATKDREVTKITISKTEITSLANLSQAPAAAAPAATTVVENSSSTTTAITESSTMANDYTTDSTTITNTTINDTTSTTSNPLSTPSSTETLVAEVSTTTLKNIEQLKEAEEELKEKVAEIEAEPIILSARV